MVALACGGDVATTAPEGTERAATTTSPAAPATREVPAPAPAAAASPSPPLTLANRATTGSPATPARPPLVVFLGDSLTAGLGLASDEAWPALVAARLAQNGTPIRPVNAGVSGDTSAGGLRRLAWLLKQKPDVVVVELGANDGMRGQPIAGVEANLRAILERSRAAGARVLLVGLRVPPSIGGDYARDFAAVYPRLAHELGVPLVPFLLEGVAGDPELNLPDGIHPNAKGQRRVADLMLPHLERVVREQPAPRAAAR